MLILGIETSCDETAASLLRIRPVNLVNLGTVPKFELLSNVVASQVEIHKRYGGIVPEVAARAHMEKILPVITEALSNFDKYAHKSDKFISNIRAQISEYPRYVDAIAVTTGPGLITSLLVGVEAAKTLSYVWKKPLIPVNHLIGHICANWLSPISTNPKFEIRNSKQIPNSKFQIPNLFPAVCLVVSGGHTKLILMRDFEKFKEIGSTRDDAAGEAFDKVAKLLDLGYPGGPIIAMEAEKKPVKGGKIISNQLSMIKLPRPMIDSDDFDFSFSGLKTAVLYTLKNKKFELVNGRAEITKKMKGMAQKRRSEKIRFTRTICAEFQQAIIDVLVEKTIRAAKKYGAKSIFLAGGVAANKELRKQLASKVRNLPFEVEFSVPAKNLCTDNAVMIAAAGYFKIIKTQEYKKIKTKKELEKFFDWRKIKVNPNLEI